jgi:hypothetical protein
MEGEAVITAPTFLTSAFQGGQQAFSSIRRCWYLSGRARQPVSSGRAVVFNLVYVYHRGYAVTSHGVSKLKKINIIS